MDKPSFYEFFSGGGMARAGLGDAWRCLLANDFDPVKAACYRDNWGGDDFVFGDINDLDAKNLPGQADLAWASFPCQDLSLAGNGAGLNGARSGAFWGFSSLIKKLAREKRRPRLLVLENVVGLLTSNGAQDFARLCLSLKNLGYRFGALTLDAAHFLPQSRQRLFIVAFRADSALPTTLVAQEAQPLWSSKALLRAYDALPDPLRKHWIWWRLPQPPQPNVTLASLIEEAPDDVAWHSPAETKRLIAMMSDVNAAKLKAAKGRAKRTGERLVGTAYRRTRHDQAGEKIQRVEARFDGVAGCLRTPAGGSSRQFLLVVERSGVRTRLLSGREAARLMGLPDDYRLPKKYNDAYHLAGDGLAVPAVRFLSEHLLLRIIDADLLANAAE